ncbi:hypothetical protein [Bradyrhizobium sp.]|uniref:hypothetical protein n=1 Tax=Bradyrhizobium sp. TaxID=376 RepID=UPI001EB9F2B1|nr:hypothetical protein [Bradyrhizobium sp.]MBV8918652.1 hypothetical protein [Bradyrhizobium sp.]MBV9982283.1 hypothetical protein [Bradyrhizobium sp.]
MWRVLQFIRRALWRVVRVALVPFAFIGGMTAGALVVGAIVSIPFLVLGIILKFSPWFEEFVARYREFFQVGLFLGLAGVAYSGLREGCRWVAGFWKQEFWQSRT